jgi:NAD(P)H dehydrogenase (quinone)
MKKILVLYYSVTGHVEAMAQAVFKGANSVPGVVAELKRVPGPFPLEPGETESAVPLADPMELADYDALIFGGPARFGNMAPSMLLFLEAAEELWVSGELVGKFASAFTATGTGGGQETTITSFWNTLAHLGMIIIGLPYTARQLLDIEEARGGSPYGAATLAGTCGERRPSLVELALGEFQGQHVAHVVSKQKTPLMFEGPDTTQ